MKKRKIKYISKDLVAQKSGSAFKEGAVRAMNENGYVVIAQEGWVVKKHSDGKIDRLHKLNGPEHLEVVLD
jgi:hypothetical protein